MWRGKHGRILPSHRIGNAQQLDHIPVRSGHRRVGKGALFARRAHNRRRWWARRQSAVSPLRPCRAPLPTLRSGDSTRPEYGLRSR